MTNHLQNDADRLLRDALKQPGVADVLQALSDIQPIQESMDSYAYTLSFLTPDDDPLGPFDNANVEQDS